MNALNCRSFRGVRFWWSLVWAILLCIPLGLLADAAAPATQPSEADGREIAALIERLGDDDWNTREQAEEEIVLFGELALPQLQEQIDSGTDPEVRSRASSAVHRIEQNRLAGPSIITLRMTDAHPRDVFQELGRQAGTHFEVQPSNLWDTLDQEITVELTRVPFWEAMKHVCAQANVFPRHWGSEQHIVLGQGQANWADGPGFVHGPFMVTASRITRSHSIDLAQTPQRRDDFTIQLTIMAEPKLRVLQSHPLVLEEAVDEHGRSLVPPAERHTHVSSHPHWRINASGRMAYPQEPAPMRLVRLRGSMRFVLQTQSQTLEVRDVLQAEESTHETAIGRIVIHPVSSSEHNTEVRATLHREGRSQEMWERANTLHRSARLLDAEDRPLPTGGGGWGGGNDQYELRWHFHSRDEVGPPVRFVLEIPTQVQEIDVPVEFDDLPIP
jgi:hypothetical protein